MGYVVFWLIMGLVVALIASSKGRSGFAWFVYGALIWPIALVHILVTPATAAALEEHEMAAGDRRKCPFCAEIIKAEAKICRYCDREVVQVEAAPDAPTATFTETPPAARAGASAGPRAVRAGNGRHGLAGAAAIGLLLFLGIIVAQQYRIGATSPPAAPPRPSALNPASGPEFIRQAGPSYFHFLSPLGAGWDKDTLTIFGRAFCDKAAKAVCVLDFWPSRADVPPKEGLDQTEAQHARRYGSYSRNTRTGAEALVLDRRP